MAFEKVNGKVLKVGLQPGRNVLARKGAMLYYKGDVRFVPHSMGGAAGGMPGMGGMVGMAGRMMSGEHVAMMAAEGHGEVFYGHMGLQIDVVDLDGAASLTVEASRLLAHDSTLQSSIVPLMQQGGVRGAVRGAMTGQGMFTSQLHGMGQVAILSHGGTIKLPVGQHPVVVDPQAYVGHVGHVQIDLAAKVGFRDAIGKGSGEAIQLKLSGQGTVWVQASEQKF